jgi:hypothetical protein
MSTVGRSYTTKQRPAVDCLASNPVQYQATLAGTEAEAVASAWAVIEA